MASIGLVSGKELKPGTAKGIIKQIAESKVKEKK
jgi:hypothetical protein